MSDTFLLVSSWLIRAFVILGQEFDKVDIRNVRFSSRPERSRGNKLVNPNWGIDMIAEVAPIPWKGRVAACSGHLDPVTHEPIPEELGHPTVYINLDKGAVGTCNYCGLRYYNADWHDPYDEE